MPLGCQALRNASNGDAASADENGVDPPSSPFDDADTVVLGEGYDVAPIADAAHGAEEDGSAEESESAEETDDGEMDVPNVPADSRGNVHPGMNLLALSVPPLPKTPASDEEVTPPPKRSAMPDESSMKKRKMPTPEPSGDWYTHGPHGDVAWFDSKGWGSWGWEPSCCMLNPCNTFTFRLDSGEAYDNSFRTV